ncbi:MAG: LON peptidase substrate-binding domain-containing protein, partial [Pseudolabrys sp.]|nr:LON peptidase substrate-binding domain-containing protein [Pseudolabrys sp.]
MTTAKPRTPLQPGENRAYPVLPLRDIVVFPHMIVPLFVGREKSIKALEEVMRSDTYILLATQKNASDDDPSTDSIYEIGTLASVLQLLKLPDGTVKVLVEGVERAKVRQYTDRADYYEADAEVLADDQGERVEAEAMARSVVTEFESYVKLNKKVSPEVIGVVQQIDDYAKLADTVASHLAVKIPDKQAILETPSVTQRLEKVLGLMESEISV